MKNQKYSVTVGISAYNEASKIASVLRGVLSQKQTNWKLDKILVFSDGSSDDTVKKAKSVKSKFITVFDDGKRKGKAFRIGQIFEKAKTELVVMFDGDIDFAGTEVIDKLVKPFDDQAVMLVGGNTRPHLPTSFFEQAVYSTFLVFDDSRKNLRGGNNLFGCTGACMVMRKKLYKDIKFPKVFTEDDFIYFSCLAKGYKFKHVSEAVVYYKLPTKLGDYLRQVFRSNPEAVLIHFRKYFGGLVDREYYRPSLFYAKSVLKVFFKNPLPVVYITLVNALCIPLFPIIAKNYKQEWFTAASTKK